MKKGKLPTVNSLETKVWNLCKLITREQYGNECICCGKLTEGKNLHTAHFFRKKFIPLQMKYDLRLLRPSCGYCNLRLHGNIEWYAVNLLRKEGQQYLIDIAEDVLMFKEEKLDTKQKRIFLENLIEKYKVIYERAVEENRRIP